MKNKRLYNIWACMKQRCNNPNHTAAEWYHDRGIRVCEEWNKFAAFEEWAMNNGYADDLTIDRIDPDGMYEPRNCRWITRKANCQRARKPNTLNRSSKVSKKKPWAVIKVHMDYGSIRRIEKATGDDEKLARRKYIFARGTVAFMARTMSECMNAQRALIGHDKTGYYDYITLRVDKKWKQYAHG